MNRIIVLAKKELNSYFNSPSGYIIAGVFLISSGWIFMQAFFLYGQASMRSFFSMMPIILIFVIPAITMSSWAEEKRSGTVEVLLTLPLESTEAVVAKFISNLVFLLLLLLLTLPIPYMLTEIGEPDRGIIFAGYLGIIFLGAAYISIGLWVSSITKNQVISFLLSLVIIFIFYIIGSSLLLDAVSPNIASVGKSLGFSSHFNSILRGVLSIRDLFYYVSIIAFFTFLNVRAVGERKWR